MKRIGILVLALGIIASGLVAGAAKSEAAAHTMFASQTCSLTSPGMVNVTLSWAGNDPAAIQQWVDVGTGSAGQIAFASIGPFSGGTTSFTFAGAAPNTVYYVRVNQQYANDVWDPSPLFQLVTGDCSAVTTATPVAVPTQMFFATQSAFIISPQTHRAFFFVDGKGHDRRDHDEDHDKHDEHDEHDHDEGDHKH